jgi:succinyl-CoA synthetase beta subunit
MEIIKKAKQQGRTTLNEEEAKQVLKEYGVPVVTERSIASIEELELSADKIDYPVVLKGLGARLTHKTERGLVRLNLKNKTDLLSAAQFIKTSAGSDLEGFLIQPMIEGKREFVVGLFRDKQFGPTVMFGLGGIFTEAIGDAVFRIAPLDEREAARMIDELHSQKLLGAFRGEKAADKNELIKTLIGLSRIGLELEDVKEIDINPLITNKDGSFAVGARIIL